jgi:hypothetical protein
LFVCSSFLNNLFAFPSHLKVLRVVGSPERTRAFQRVGFVNLRTPALRGYPGWWVHPLWVNLRGLRVGPFFSNPNHPEIPRMVGSPMLGEPAWSPCWAVFIQTPAVRGLPGWWVHPLWVNLRGLRVGPFYSNPSHPEIPWMVGSPTLGEPARSPRWAIFIRTPAVQGCPRWWVHPLSHRDTQTVGMPIGCCHRLQRRLPGCNLIATRVLGLGTFG